MLKRCRSQGFLAKRTAVTAPADPSVFAQKLAKNKFLSKTYEDFKIRVRPAYQDRLLWSSLVLRNASYVLVFAHWQRFTSSAQIQKAESPTVLVGPMYVRMCRLSVLVLRSLAWPSRRPTCCVWW
jgi:hypothetical protein